MEGEALNKARRGHSRAMIVDMARSIPLTPVLFDALRPTTRDQAGTTFIEMCLELATSRGSLSASPLSSWGVAQACLFAYQVTHLANTNKAITKERLSNTVSAALTRIEVFSEDFATLPKPAKDWREKLLKVSESDSCLLPDGSLSEVDAHELRKFFRWCVSTGMNINPRTGYRKLSMLAREVAFGLLLTHRDLGDVRASAASDVVHEKETRWYDLLFPENRKFLVLLGVEDVRELAAIEQSGSAGEVSQRLGNPLDWTFQGWGVAGSKARRMAFDMAGIDNDGKPLRRVRGAAVLQVTVHAPDHRAAVLLARRRVADAMAPYMANNVDFQLRFTPQAGCCEYNQGSMRTIKGNTPMIKRLTPMPSSREPHLAPCSPPSESSARPPRRPQGQPWAGLRSKLPA